MAKQRKSIFEASTSQTEINQAAMKAQKEAIGDIPAKKDVPPAATDKDGKPMHLYVDAAHHRQAKVKASLKGMKLGEYIEWLIAQDKTDL